MSKFSKNRVFPMRYQKVKISTKIIKNQNKSRMINFNCQARSQLRKNLELRLAPFLNLLNLHKSSQYIMKINI